MNNEILRRLGDQNLRQHDIYSVDKIIDEHDDNQQNLNNNNQDDVALEFIHSITPSGMPPHKLSLKIGAVVILLRNLFIEIGVCNGTRMVVKQIGRIQIIE